MLLLGIEVAVVVCVKTPYALLVGAVCEPLLAVFASAASACVAINACVYDVKVLAVFPAVAADSFIVIGEITVLDSPLLVGAALFLIAFFVMICFAYATYELSASFALAVTVGA